ncbi:MAG: PIG-L deacetylase family protein [Actinomycetota bacterium]|nr:PIG-L deacetylase family protein [Actinomycetota bacterium]
MAANEPGQPDPTHSLTSFDLPTPSSALAIGAHPDDVEFGCGGTLAKWAAAGCTVHHLVLTDGSKGTWNPEADVPALVAARQAEQRRAAQVLAGSNAGEVVFLGQVDGELEHSLALRGEVARVIRQLRPQVVLAHDPWKQYRLHPDHREAGILACDGVVAARDPHFFKEHGLAHHRPETLLLWEAEVPDHVEDVTGFVDAKLFALEAHESQFESTMKAVDPEQLAGFRTRIRARLAGLGEPYGVAAAELFKRISDL